MIALTATAIAILAGALMLSPLLLILITAIERVRRDNR